MSHLQTGVSAGARDKDGKYPPGSVNDLCEIKLQKFNRLRRQKRKGRTL